MSRMSFFETEGYCADGRKAIFDEQGTPVTGAKNSAETLKLAGLGGWNVVKEKVYHRGVFTGLYANVRTDRDKDNQLGFVKGRYTLLQNEEAFSFMDLLQGGEVLYEQAGYFGNGEIVYILGRLNNDYTILGDKVTPYIVLKNSFDGSSGIKVAMIPQRISCRNSLNAQIRKSHRTWSARHSGSIETKLAEARETLEMADAYMKGLTDKFESLYKIKLGDKDHIKSIVDMIVPVDDSITERKKRNLLDVQNDILYRYFNMPDLVVMDNTAARLIHAVSDTASHKEPSRRTKDFDTNRFKKFIDGNNMMVDIGDNKKQNIIDRAISVVEGM